MAGDRSRAGRRGPDRTPGDCGHTQRPSGWLLDNVARALVAHRGEALLNVSFFGVRARPCPCDETAATAATSCVQLDAPGTRSCSTSHRPAPARPRPALRRVVRGLGAGHTCTGTTCRGCRSSRPSWCRAPSSTCTAPRRRPARSTRRSTVSLRPPFFPVTVEEADHLPRRRRLRPRDRRCQGAGAPRAARGDEQRLPRRGRGATVAYLADHQMPHDGSFAVSGAVLELAMAPTWSSTARSTPTTSSPRSTGGTARSTTRCS